MDDTISRNEAIKATLALCPQNTKPGSLDEYGTTILCAVVDVILKQLPAVDAIPVEWLRSQLKNNPNDIESAYDGICINELIDRWQKEQEAR